MGEAGSQLFFHLNENPQPALSSFAHRKMPISGLDLIQGQVSAGTHETEAPGPAITVDLEIQGMGEGVDPDLPPEAWQPLPPWPGPHPLAHPFVLMSKKEVFLSSWVLGKFKVKTLPTSGQTHGSFLCQGCGWEH